MNASKTKVLSEFHKGAGELVRISLTEFRGKKYLSLWVFYDTNDENSESPDWKPSKKGLCISIDLLDDLREGLEKAAEAAGLSDRQTDEKHSGACTNGGDHGPGHDARAKTSREDQGKETA